MAPDYNSIEITYEPWIMSNRDVNGNIQYIKPIKLAKDIFVDDLRGPELLSGKEKEDLYDKFVKGIWEKENPTLNKEEKEMNARKIVDLYYERKCEKIRKEQRELEEQEIQKNEFVQRYNELVNIFKASMDELYNEEGAKDVLTNSCYDYDFRYEISDSFKDRIHSEMLSKFEEAIKPLKDERDEILVLLEISDDKDYVINVLTKRGIIDKNFNMVEE